MTPAATRHPDASVASGGSAFCRAIFSAYVARCIDPVLEEITRLLIDRCTPDRVVLFGSRARGDHHPDSDYDIIVVLDTPLDRSARDAPVREALGKRTPKLDVIVYTPAEFDRLRSDVGDLAYAGEVKGCILYDCTPGRWPKQVCENRQDPPESRYPRAPLPTPDEVGRAIEDANVVRQAVRAALNIG